MNLDSVYTRAMIRMLTLDDILEVPYDSVLLEGIIQARDLDEPANVMRIELVLDYPFR